MTSRSDPEGNYYEEDTRSSKRKWIIIVAAAVALILVCVGGYYLWNRKKEEKPEGAPSVATGSMAPKLNPRVITPINSFILKNPISEIVSGKAMMATSNQAKHTVAIVGKKEVVVFDRETDKTFNIDLSKNTEGTLSTVGISPDGTHIVCAYHIFPSWNNTYRAYIYKLKEDRNGYAYDEKAKEFYFKFGTSFIFSPDNKFLLATDSSKKEHMLKDLSTPDIIKAKFDTISQFNAVCFAGNRLFFLVLENGQTALKSYNLLQLDRTAQHHGEFSHATGIQASLDGKSLVIYGKNLRTNWYDFSYCDISSPETTSGIGALNLKFESGFITDTGIAKGKFAHLQAKTGSKLSSYGKINAIFSDKSSIDVVSDDMLFKLFSSELSAKTKVELPTTWQSGWPRSVVCNHYYFVACEEKGDKTWALNIYHLQEKSEAAPVPVKPVSEATTEPPKPATTETPKTTSEKTEETTTPKEG